MELGPKNTNKFFFLFKERIIPVQMCLDESYIETKIPAFKPKVYLNLIFIFKFLFNIDVNLI